MKVYDNYMLPNDKIEMLQPNKHILTPQIMS